MTKITSMSTEIGRNAFRQVQRIATAHGVTNETILIRFALERLLVRIFEGEGADRMVLKGGMLIMLTEGVGPLQGRSTQDMDVQVPGYAGTVAEFAELIDRSAALTPSAGDDGVRFEPSRVTAERGDANVPGCSLKLTAHVGAAKIGLKVDCTFDARGSRLGYPVVRYPSITGEPFLVRSFAIESQMSDKIVALIRHGSVSYRMRDFYDLYQLFTRNAWKPSEVAEGLAETLELFGTDLPHIDEVAALAPENVEPRLAAWDKEMSTRRFGREVPPFGDVVAFVRKRVEVVLSMALLADAKVRHGMS